MNRTEAREKATALVAQMTIEEAASQLLHSSPAIPRLGIPAYDWWSEALHGVARAGTATCYPQAIGLGATFDRELLQKIAGSIALEARAKYNAYSRLGDRTRYKGVTMWSPNINIFRDPRWGRGQETYGEDPVLTASLGCAFVEGLQTKKRRLPDHCRLCQTFCGAFRSRGSASQFRRQSYEEGSVGNLSSRF